jgi:uncharacterized protein (DUF3084 family)
MGKPEPRSDGRSAATAPIRAARAAPKERPMSVHPNPMSMAVNVEHHRQELLDQAHQERLAKEAIAGAAQAREGRSEVGTVVASRAWSLFSRLRPALTQPLNLPQSAPGDTR